MLLAYGAMPGCQSVQSPLTTTSVPSWRNSLPSHPSSNGRSTRPGPWRPHLWCWPCPSTPVTSLRPASCVPQEAFPHRTPAPRASDRSDGILPTYLSRRQVPPWSLRFLTPLATKFPAARTGKGGVSPSTCRRCFFQKRRTVNRLASRQARQSDRKDGSHDEDENRRGGVRRGRASLLACRPALMRLPTPTWMPSPRRTRGLPAGPCRAAGRQAAFVREDGVEDPEARPLSHYHKPGPQKPVAEENQAAWL